MTPPRARVRHRLDEVVGKEGLDVAHVRRAHVARLAALEEQRVAGEGARDRQVRPALERVQVLDDGVEVAAPL